MSYAPDDIDAIINGNVTVEQTDDHILARGADGEILCEWDRDEFALMRAVVRK